MSVHQYMNRLALEKQVSQEKKRLTSPEVRAAVRRLQRLDGLQAERSFFLLQYQEEDKRWQAPTPFAPCAPTLQYLQTTLSLSSHSSLKRNLVCRQATEEISQTRVSPKGRTTKDRVR